VERVHRGGVGGVLREPDRFRVIAMIQSSMRRIVKCFNRFLRLPHGKLQLAQPRMNSQVVRLRLQQLSQQRSSLRLSPAFQVHFRQLQIQRPCLAEDALLNVKLRQSFQRARFLGRELCYFFVNGDGFGCESVVQKNLCELFKIFQRLKGFALAHEQIAQGHQGDLILRFILQDLLIFRDGLRHLPLLQILLRRVNVLAFVVRHLQMLFPLYWLERTKSDSGKFVAVLAPGIRPARNIPVGELLPRSLAKAASRADEYARGMLTGGTLFEELGFYYVGPVDGHDIEMLVSILENVRDAKQEGPILVHVVTEKGKGHPFSKPDKERYHAIAGFDPRTLELKKALSAASDGAVVARFSAESGFRFSD